MAKQLLDLNFEDHQRVRKYLAQIKKRCDLVFEIIDRHPPIPPLEDGKAVQEVGGLTREQWVTWWGHLMMPEPRVRKIMQVTNKRWAMMRAREKEWSKLLKKRGKTMREVLEESLKAPLPDWVFRTDGTRSGNWFCFDWVFSPKGFTSIMEGRFNDSPREATPPSRKYL